MVSRDGLALGASPASEEHRAMGAWTRLAMLGDVEKGFVAMAEEVWVFCRRGPYGAVALADPSGRPGVVLARLEEALLVAEEDRSRREDLRSAAREQPPSDGARRLRAPLLHRERPAPAAAASAAPEPTPTPRPVPTPAPRQAAPPPTPAPAGGRVDLEPAPGAPKAPPGAETDDLEIDAVALAREFGALYFTPDPDDEA